MTTYPETETVARILARGYNRHTQDHGPDGSAAGEVTQTADGHGLLVVRDGAEYAVRVSGAKPFEVRRDDRGFQRGDRVRLVEVSEARTRPGPPARSFPPGETREWGRWPGPLSRGRDSWPGPVRCGRPARNPPGERPPVRDTDVTVSDRTVMGHCPVTAFLCQTPRQPPAAPGILRLRVGRVTPRNADTSRSRPSKMSPV